MKRSGSGAPDSNEFYQKWRYAQASDILPYIFATAREGQVDEILDAMDEFGLRYPMYKLGHEKGLILEEELSKLNPKPKVALELGTFLGYSAMRTARILGEGGKLTCIEYNPEHSEVAMTLIKYAGLGDRVKIITGSSTDVLPDLWDFGKADFILLDHKKSLYLPDTLTMEKLGIIQAGTVLAADNVIYPGAPDFLDHVQKGPMYATRIREAAFEYDLKWKQDWESKADGISFSVRQ